MPLIVETDLLRDISELLAHRSAMAGVPAVGELAPPDRDLRPLRDVLAARRSVREFSRGPVAEDDVEFLIHHATAVTRHGWPAASKGLAVLASRPTPLLRERYAPAPVLFAVCGDLTWACSPDGPGYGGLLVSAGALGHAIWLSALSIGLAASVFGGPCDDITEAPRPVDPDMRHLFTVAVGPA
jgi:hypothetical protein